jgi:predicted RNA-binding protein with PUA-like domain
VRLRYGRTFGRLLSLEELRDQVDAETLPVVRRGNRLSILPVEEASALRIYALLGETP